VHHKLDLAEVKIPGFSSAEISKMHKEELEREKADREIIETAEKKNAVESYVYELKSELDYELAEFAEAEEKTTFCKRLEETKAWLYGEGENASKDVYAKRLEDLKKVGEKIRKRKKEFEEREEAIHILQAGLNEWRAWAQDTISADAKKYEHITKEERENVMKKCVEIEENVMEKAKKQKDAPKEKDPIIFNSDILHAKDNLDAYCKPIKNKIKPIPKKEEKEKEEEKKKTNEDQKSKNRRKSIIRRKRKKVIR